MLTEDGKHLYVSYDEYHNLIEKLAIKVYQSGWQFDTILCLARGGMRPGDILSRVFDKPLAIMSTSSYRADAGTPEVRTVIDIRTWSGMMLQAEPACNSPTDTTTACSGFALRETTV